jgi:hypothetical protein
VMLAGVSSADFCITWKVTPSLVHMLLVDTLVLPDIAMRMNHKYRNDSWFWLYNSDYQKGLPCNLI